MVRTASSIAKLFAALIFLFVPSALISQSVQVTPDGTDVTKQANTSGHTAVFTVTNGSSAETIGFECRYNNSPVTDCDLSSEREDFLANQSRQITATYDVGGAGSGALRLRATVFDAMGVYDEGSYDVTVNAPPAEVSVTPDGTSTDDRESNTGPYTAVFTVENSGGTTGSFNLSCNDSDAPVTCSNLNKDSVNLAPDSSTTVTATYSVGAAGEGTVKLDATGDDVGFGYYTVPVVRYGVSTTPDGTSTPTRIENTGTYSEVFNVENTGSEQNNYDIACWGLDNVTCTSHSLTNVTLASGADTTVTAHYTVGNRPGDGEGVLRLRATSKIGPEKINHGSYEVPISYKAPTVSPSSGTEPNRDPFSGGHEASFTVKNEASTSAAFTFSCGSTGGVSCTGTDTTGVTLGAGQEGTVKAHYNITGDANGTVSLMATSPQGNDTGSYTVPVGGVHGVVVGRDGRSVMQERSDSDLTREFYVKNTGNTAATYNLSCTRSGAATSCSVDSASVVIEPGVSRPTVVTYNTGTSATGWVRLKAARSGDSTVRDSAQVTVITVASSAPLVSVEEVTPGASWNRNQCLTVSVGPSAAWQCGDLRIAHSLPSIQAYGRPMTPTLTYNSLTAHPNRQIVGAHVTIQSTASVPDSVVAEVSVNGTSRRTGSWPGSEWDPGETRRISLVVDAYNDSTGVYPYSLEVTSWYPDSTTYSTEVSGKYALVNRKDSPYGAGWWVAGVEELTFLPDDEILWVGGDGSTRLYVEVENNVWVADLPEYPDTLKKVGTEYLRLLPQRDSVMYYASGRHKFTANRVGRKTIFTYNLGRLYQIVLPIPGDSLYQFSYDANSKLKRVTAPGSRQTNVYVSNSRIDSIADPDSEVVHFTHDGSSMRISRRTDKRGSVTKYAYGSRSYRLLQVKMLLDADTIMTMYSWAHPWLGRAGFPYSGHGSRSAGSVFSYVRWPRYYASGDDNANQYTYFYHTRFGSPRCIRDAEGNYTYISRDDAQYEGLVTHIEHPNDWVQHAGYDERGNLVVSTDSSTDATTRYVWDDKWNFVTSMVTPEGDRVDIAYDSTTGNRIWQQDSRGYPSRVTYSYHTSANMEGLLRYIYTPLTPATEIDYDLMGNLKWTKSPLGYYTWHYRDGIGRDTLVVSPIGQDTVLRQRTVYDIMNRVDTTMTIGPAMKYVGYQSTQYTVPAETLVVANTYDDEGNLEEVRRRTYPDPNSIGWEISTFTYDSAGRQITATHNGNTTTNVYDPAGNVTRLISGRGDTVRMKYDVLDRLEERIVPAVSYDHTQCAGQVCGTSADQNYQWNFPAYPNDGGDSLVIWADTSTFTYDAMSNMLTANNRYARVKRSYYDNGALKTDSVRIRQYGGTTFTTHVYGVRYKYDLNGRRTELHHPGSLVPTVGDTIQTYTYSSFGALDSVISVQDNAYSYSYDLMGRQTGLTFPGGSLTLEYDNDSRLMERTEYVGSTKWHDEVYTRDRRGRLLTVDKVGSPNPEYWWEADMAYSGLGHVVWTSVYDDVSGIYNRESFRADALGRTYWHEQGGPMMSDPDTEEHDYAYLSGRVANIYGEEMPGAPTTWFPDSTFTVDDDDGNVVQSGKRRNGWNGEGLGDRLIWQNKEGSWNYYGADQRLMFRQVYRDSIDTNLDYVRGRGGVFEEYWYDALGRRVLLRQRGGDDMNSNDLCWDIGNQACDDGFERYIWDGDQLLYETRYAGSNDKPRSGSAADQYGWLGYTFGAALDAPLDVMRMNYSATSGNAVVLHTNWRGFHDSGTFDNGTLFTGDVGWPASADVYLGDGEGEPDDWVGSLIGRQLDRSGLMYMRNRYYDPGTGQFSQQDPIGLAGGLNLYGFAGGDPVNFWDPFGLCEDENGEWRRCEVTISSYGEEHGASLDDLTQETRDVLQALADIVDMDIGINATSNGQHRDDGHANGTAVDIGFLNGKSIGYGNTTHAGMGVRADNVQRTVANNAGLFGVKPNGYGNLGPSGRFRGFSGPTSVRGHANHIHLSFVAGGSNISGLKDLAAKARLLYRLSRY